MRGLIQKLYNSFQKKLILHTKITQYNILIQLAIVVIVCYFWKMSQRFLGREPKVLPQFLQNV